MATEVILPTPDYVAADVGMNSGQTPGDCYGTSTIAFGTEIVKVCAPKYGHLTRLNWFSYNCGGTAHTVTIMVPLAKTFVSTDAATGQAVVKFKAIPTAADGSILAASDFVIIRNEQGVFDAYKVASISGLNVTLTASVGAADANVVTTKLLQDAPIWFMGAPADHVKRQYTMTASAVKDYGGAKMALATTKQVNEPILIHSNNATATGYLTGPAFEHIRQ